jgi:hypothetical protein
MRILVLLLAALTLCACATVPTDPNFAAIAQVRSAGEQAKGAAAEKCADSADVAACMLGLAAIYGGGAGAGQISYQRPPTQAEQLAGVVSALTPAIGLLANGAVAWHQADANRDTAIAQFGYLEGVVRSSVDGMQAVATGATSAAATIATAGPDVTTIIGGDVTTGDGNATRGSHIGDTVGGDQVGGDLIRDSGNTIDSGNTRTCTVTVGPNSQTTQGVLTPSGQCVAREGG